ncbi:restriction endonuclease subunit S [Tenacibaculum ovolyticum]|uniref:restriction endonuclease subunit S n=1 Tax=Tenacibaculum ovolyticum TaxID=104270 RepID=UPI0022F3BC82|nr:restriction endonuclease subunit S [Tenacibaculum ovolyticum]WBX74862.1 restriction endonuclease subunit S [Tenacibaculum ovolyticum]
MSIIKLKDLVHKPIQGEWGKEESEDTLGDSIVNLIRTTNFLSTGQIDYSNITQRAILKKKKTENGEVWLADFDKIESKRLKNKDLVIEKSGGGAKTPVGRVVIFESEKNKTYLCSNFLTVLRPKLDIVIPEFLLYQFKYLYQVNKVKKYQNQTTGLYNLKLGRYLDVEINLPSITEQSIIVAQLNIIQQLIDDRIKTVELLDEYVGSKFLEMFGDPVLNDKKWELKTIEELVINKKGAIRRGPFGGSLKKEFFKKQGYLVYEQYHALNNDFSFERYFIDEEKYKELDSFKVSSGEIIISCSGVNLGRLAIIPEVFKKGIINQALLKLSLNKDKMLQSFFVNVFTDTNFRKKYFRKRGSQVLNFPPIVKFKKFEFIAPPISLQQEFDEIFKKNKILKEKYQKSQSLLEILFQSTLQNAFDLDAVVDEEIIFEDILPNLNTSDFKKGKRIDYLLNLLKKDGKKDRFSNIENYNLALNKLLLLLEEGSIEQYLEKENIKLKKSL